MLGREVVPPYVADGETRITVPTTHFSQNRRVGIKIQLIKDGLVRVDDLVKMNAAISKPRSRDLHANDASGTGPGSLLGGCSLGVNDTGNQILRRDYI